MHNRKVLNVRFQTALDFPGVTGALGNVLPSQSKTLDNLDMTVQDELLEVRFDYKRGHHVLLVPLTNIVFMRAAPEDKKALKS